MSKGPNRASGGHDSPRCPSLSVDVVHEIKTFVRLFFFSLLFRVRLLLSVECCARIRTRVSVGSRGPRCFARKEEKRAVGRQMKRAPFSFVHAQRKKRRVHLEGAGGGGKGKREAAVLAGPMATLARLAQDASPEISLGHLRSGGSTAKKRGRPECALVHRFHTDSNHGAFRSTHGAGRHHRSAAPVFVFFFVVGLFSLSFPRHVPMQEKNICDRLEQTVSFVLGGGAERKKEKKRGETGKEKKKKGGGGGWVRREKDQM